MRSWIKLRFSVVQGTVVTGIAKIKVKFFKVLSLVSEIKLTYRQTHTTVPLWACYFHILQTAYANGKTVDFLISCFCSFTLT